MHVFLTCHAKMATASPKVYWQVAQQIGFLRARFYSKFMVCA